MRLKIMHVLQHFLRIIYFPTIVMTFSSVPNMTLHMCKMLDLFVRRFPLLLWGFSVHAEATQSSTSFIMGVESGGGGGGRGDASLW